MPDRSNHNAMRDAKVSRWGGDSTPAPGTAALEGSSKNPCFLTVPRRPWCNPSRGRGLWAVGASSPDRNRPPFSGAGVHPRKVRTEANGG